MKRRRIDPNELIGDVVASSHRIRDVGVTLIFMVSGRYLVLLDLPSGHSVTAFDPRGRDER